MPSPPKPWETNTTGQSPISTPPLNSAATGQSFNSNLNTNESNVETNSSTNYTGTTPMTGYQNNTYSGYGTGYGSSYGSGYGSSYGSGYGSSFGSGYGYGSRYGSGYGGMGIGSYGGMSSYGGMGSYGGFGQPYSRQGMYPGMQGNMGPNQEPSLMDQMAQSSQSTFQLLERVVGTFGGIAQMLDSTFFATHSSFMAMVGVAEQFGLLKHMLSNVFSVFSVFRWVRDFLYRVRGKRPPIDPKELSVTEFNKFSETTSYSFKPLFMFFSLVFGVPYLLHLFMRSIARRQEKERRDNGRLTNPGSTIQSFEFAQAVKDFSSQNTGEISFAKGDLIAILSKEEASLVNKQDSDIKWWQGRLRNGVVGLFPSNCVEVLEKSSDAKDSTPNNVPQSSSNSVPDLPQSFNSGQSYNPSYPYNSQNYRSQSHGSQMYAPQSYGSNRYSTYPSNNIYNGSSYQTSTTIPYSHSQNY